MITTMTSHPPAPSPPTAPAVHPSPPCSAASAPVAAPIKLEPASPTRPRSASDMDVDPPLSPPRSPAARAPPPPPATPRATNGNDTRSPSRMATSPTAAARTRPTSPPRSPAPPPPPPSVVTAVLTRAAGQPSLILDGLVSHVGPAAAARYTASLSQFLAAKISRREFERVVAVSLPREGVQLHNALIMSVLRAARGVAGEDVGDGGLGYPYRRKRRRMETAETRRVRLRGEAMMLPKPDRDRIRVEMKKQEESKRAAPVEHPVVLAPHAKVRPHLHGDYVRLLATPTCQMEQELPSRATLRDRMQCMAYEQGIERVADDAVDLVAHALENYLKTILDTCVRVQLEPDAATSTDADATTADASAPPPPSAPVPASSPRPAPASSAPDAAVGSPRRKRAAPASPHKPPQPPPRPADDHARRDTLLTLPTLATALALTPARAADAPHILDRALARTWHPAAEDRELARALEATTAVAVPETDEAAGESGAEDAAAAAAMQQQPVVAPAMPSAFALPVVVAPGPLPKSQTAGEDRLGEF
ncbi:hypothetical protein GGF31_007600 [Allomyces arbusculus]|nr:hypothetical protein GGF31_007600 [Allomyces arbusculus]